MGRLSAFGTRSRGHLGAGLERVRASVALAAQTGVAGGLAWYIAHDLIGEPTPFFAPIAAVVTLAVSVGQRLQRAAELVIGVALGIGVGDLILLVIGSGPWQLGIMVAFAVVAAAALGGGGPLVVQAAGSAVLVAAFSPTGAAPYSRFVDALVGGAVGLAVMAVLLPLNPLTVVRRAAEPALDLLADGLHEVAAALAERDVDRAERALTALRAGEAPFAAFRSAVDAARENSALAPARWRSRAAITRYVESADQLLYALRNVRVLVRRVLTALRDDEPVPPELPDAVGLLGDAVALLRGELAGGAEPVATRERALRAAGESGRAYTDGVAFSGGVVVAQIRSTATDLLRATGITHADAVQLVRGAAARYGGTGLPGS
ncbi:FUSC family protein [Spirilliplanes yamanashiensis]|uniref:Integral membrane bound transporter domain-containing protein n=1 Tax=Spirilliplanes yamanashiensis TaxID=42233 RepID=A0A8J4DHT5_9ACTN|nr:FUSC family protein [Spirilliplanes yamanashiensis]MDP9814475.1 uncharacterized membrane protein YgaE (UPF0421/DUF939 family) [Spirilliplanes yamanashiensis]GIJ02126.1 hypothetical protein Sya03_14780 [Spirilliplanes yamanashiensis]